MNNVDEYIPDLIMDLMGRIKAEARFEEVRDRIHFRKVAGKPTHKDDATLLFIIPNRVPGSQVYVKDAESEIAADRKRYVATTTRVECRLFMDGAFTAVMDQFLSYLEFYLVYQQPLYRLCKELRSQWVGADTQHGAMEYVISWTMPLVLVEPDNRPFIAKISSTIIDYDWNDDGIVDYTSTVPRNA